MNLNELVKFKRGLGRAKDLADIVIIEEYLAGRVGNPDGLGCPTLPEITRHDHEALG